MMSMVVLSRRKDVRLCALRDNIFEHVEKMPDANEGGGSQDGDPGEQVRSGEAGKKVILLGGG